MTTLKLQVAALTLAVLGFASHAEAAFYFCEHHDGGMYGYWVKMAVAPGKLTIEQGSRTGSNSYPPVDKAIRQVEFTSPIEAPEISCARAHDMMTTEILVKGSVVQVWQYSRTERRAPQQFEIATD